MADAHAELRTSSPVTRREYRLSSAQTAPAARASCVRPLLLDWGPRRRQAPTPLISGPPVAHGGASLFVERKASSGER